jgi:hypothetical protein
MQTQLALKGIISRPRVHSSEVIEAAIEAFLAENELSKILPDFAPDDEDWLRKPFRKVAKRSHDAWEAASKFAAEMGDTVGEDYVDLFEIFNSHLSRWQDEVIRNWVASGGASNPLTGKIHRVETHQGSEVQRGIAFNDPKRAELGTFTFLPDADRLGSISKDGEITRFLILPWESIGTIEDPTEDDLQLYEKHVAAKEAQDAAIRQWKNKLQAERERDDFIRAHALSDEEAQNLYVTLGFPDEASAARAANAVFAVLMQRRLKALS